MKRPSPRRRLRASLFLAVTGLFFGLASTGASAGTAQDDLSRLPTDAVQLYTVLKPRADDLKWEQIPWLTDLEEGFRVAKEERRPLFLWVSGYEPLERC